MNREDLPKILVLYCVVDLMLVKSTSQRRKQEPQVVDGKEYGLFQKLLARIDRANLDNDWFLGYCVIHKTYFIDLEHTNGHIRCPLCDKEWLMKRGILSSDS